MFVCNNTLSRKVDLVEVMLQCSLSSSRTIKMNQRFHIILTGRYWGIIGGGVNIFSPHSLLFRSYNVIFGNSGKSEKVICINLKYWTRALNHTVYIMLKLICLNNKIKISKQCACLLSREAFLASLCTGQILQTSNKIAVFASTCAVPLEMDTPPLNVTCDMNHHNP
jgi:hypothetical protein